jgi:HEAT repeat protein
LLGAGRAIDDLLAAFRDTPEDREMLRRAAHQALGALEQAFMRLQHVRHPEAYQVLLDVAYL